MGLICEAGCASLADFPYDQTNCVRWPSESAYAHAIPFRTRDWSWFRIEDTTGLNMVKQLLANGSTASLSIAVWGNFDNIGNYHNIYCSSERTGSNRGGHLVTFVGYDDTMTTADGVGAFKMVNSWGTSWGAAGYFWMSYDAVHDGYLSEGAVGYMMDTVGYVPQLLARVKVQHPTRDRVSLGFSVGGLYNALWLKDFRSWRRAIYNQPFPDNKIVFDLTDAADFITGGQTDSIYFWATDQRPDGQAGAVEHYAVQYLPWGTNLVVPGMPRAIPDDGTSLTVGMQMVELDRDVSVSNIMMPVGILDPNQSYTPKVEVRNYGNLPASFPVWLAIGSNYCETLQVTGLAQAEAETLEFSSWTMPPRCTVAVRCSTGLVADEYPSNDAAAAVTWAWYVDVGILEITAPEDTVDSGEIVRPSVRLRNNGTQAATFVATFIIPDESYLRSSRVTLAPEVTQAVTFATWTPRTLGSHAFRCSLDMAGDMDRTNDLMSGTTYVRAGAGIAEAAAGMFELKLDAPRPTVFSRSVELSYSLPKAGAVQLAVYDAAGARVRLLFSGPARPGRYRLNWDGNDEQGRPVASGAYFCRFQADGQRFGASLLKL